MAARASISCACETSVGKVREHNEDSYFIDVGHGVFAVCDGMGGHAAGEVASAIAVEVLREHWAGPEVAAATESWLELGTPEARRQLVHAVQAGVVAAHTAIIAEADRDRSKHGMGTTVVGALVVGGDVVFAHCGDSRAYLVRDAIAMQLTEDHTLLARLLAAGIDVDTSSEGARFKSMLTNALGIGHECKVATFIVPVATGDRFLLCSDGITEYLKEVEIGETLSTQPSPARAAQKLVEVALQRGGADNATALVVKVVEAGETARPVEQLQRDSKVIASCPLFVKSTPQGVLRALRIALPREFPAGERVPAQTLGDRVAWIVVEGEVELEGGNVATPGALLYPEALQPSRPLPDKHGLGVVSKDVRALALRADDFKELCVDDAELGEQLEAALARLLDRAGGQRAAAAPAVDENEEEPTAVHRDPAAPAPIAPEAESTKPGIGGRAVEPATIAPSARAVAIAATLPPGSAVPVVAPPPPASAASFATAPTAEIAVPVLPPRPRSASADLGTAPTLPPRKQVPAPASAAQPQPQPKKRSTEDEPTRPEGLLGQTRAELLGRSPTPPMGVVQRAPAAHTPTRAEIERGATLPQIKQIARPAAPVQPPPKHVVATGPAPAKSETKEVRAAADAQIDRVFSEMTDATHTPRPRDTPLAQPAVEPATDPEVATEITIEAEPPPQQPAMAIARPARAPAHGDDSDPEISIERLVEFEVDEPMNAAAKEAARDTLPDPTDGVLVIQTNRPVTANDATHVAGSIDTKGD